MKGANSFCDLHAGEQELIMMLERMHNVSTGTLVEDYVDPCSILGSESSKGIKILEGHIALRYETRKYLRSIFSVINAVTVNGGGLVKKELEYDPCEFIESMCEIGMYLLK